jgi:predicted RNA-binding Zn-ribbon protein involved in translation (DUF1610 family)
MTSLTEDEKKNALAALEKAGARLPCPRCGSEHISLLDGLVMEFLQSQQRNMVVGSGNRYVCAATVCERCGFLSQHSLSVLGIE